MFSGGNLQKINRYLLGEGERRVLSQKLNRFVTWLSVLISLYNLCSVFYFPEAILHRGISFGLFFGLLFLIYTMPGTQTKTKIPFYDWVFVLLSFSVSIYISINLTRLVSRYPFVDPVHSTDIFFGFLTVILLLEGTRRIIGPWLSILCAFSVFYGIWGCHIPGLFGHSGFSIKSIIDELFLTTDGIWGSAIGIATSYIVIFILFGAFLQNSGAADFIFDLASAIAGWSKGGLAKVGIIASSFFDTGSPSANVSCVGAITIPMMKKSGYPSDFAAAVECCASTGNTFTPPVMGAVAFIMAGVIGVPYAKVAAAAVLPALIYYLALFFTVDFRAGKLGMKGLSKEEIPSLGKTLLKGLPFLIPMTFLIFRLMSGYNPSRVGLETIIIIIAISWFRKDLRMDIKKIIKSLADGAKQAIMVIATMATSGIILGTINLTGIGIKFSSLVMLLGGHSTLGTLLLTMALAMFLGLAMNITPTYLLTAVIAGPTLVKLGISPIAAHMFILFFAAMATMTPPVASTAFTAAGIAGAPPMRVGFLAMRIAIVAYFMPFLFIYQPALLFQGSLVQILMAFLVSVSAVALLSMGIEGWFNGNLSFISRVVLVFAGLLAFTGYLPLIITSIILLIIILTIGKFRLIPIKN